MAGHRIEVDHAAVDEAAGIPERVDQLLAMDAWSRERRASWSSAQLERQLELAREIPYWRDKAGPGVRLAELPLLDRATLQRRFDDLLAPWPGLVARKRTSGSSGRPVEALHGPSTVGYAAAARLRQLAWFGMTPVDHPQLNMRIAARSDDPVVRRSTREPVLFWLNPYRLDAAAVRQAHGELVAAGGVRLIGAESSLLDAWGRLYEDSGCDARELGVQLIVAGGEMTYAEQRGRAARVFGCPVTQQYGSHELSMLATECPEGALHIVEEAVHVELLDGGGRPVEAGTPGEVVVSLLHNDPMPLLRYRLGDVATRRPEPCPCGRPSATLDVAVGRAEEMLLRPDGGFVHPRFLRSIYERVFGDELRAFHTVQRGPAELAVRLELGRPAPVGAAAELEREIHAYLQARMAVTVQEGKVEAPAGKLRTFSRAFETG